MQHELYTTKFEGVEYRVIEDTDINLSEHCDHCDLRSKCEEYVEKNEWMACGATFQSNNVYLKEIK